MLIAEIAGIIIKDVTKQKICRNANSWMCIMH